jgi:puromycin-sensitive aminopeptidase
LKINKATVKAEDGSVYESIETIYIPEQETANLLFSKPLPVSSNAVLDMEFTGELNDKMKGFYRSKYFSSTGDFRTSQPSKLLLTWR